MFILKGRAEHNHFPGIVREEYDDEEEEAISYWEGEKIKGGASI
jgi:hypothetical protein